MSRVATPPPPTPPARCSGDAVTFSVRRNGLGRSPVRRVLLADSGGAGFNFGMAAPMALPPSHAAGLPPATGGPHTSTGAGHAADHADRFSSAMDLASSGPALPLEALPRPPTPDGASGRAARAEAEQRRADNLLAASDAAAARAARHGEEVADCLQLNGADDGGGPDSPRGKGGRRKRCGTPVVLLLAGENGEAPGFSGCTVKEEG